MQTTNTTSGDVLRFRIDSAAVVAEQSLFVPGQEYRWEVRSVCLDTSWSNWSHSFRFTLEAAPPSGVTEQSITGRQHLFSLVPNPAENWVELHAQQYPKQPWSAAFYDAGGQLRLQQSCTANQACRIVLTQLEAGVYTVRITTENSLETLRLVRLDLR